MSATGHEERSLLELFRLEAEEQVKVLTRGLLEIERTADAPGALEACMRAAHSLKGAARVVGIQPAVDVAHAMEDILVAAQRGQRKLDRDGVNRLLRAVDLLERIGQKPEAPQDAWQRDAQLVLEALKAGAAEGGESAAPAPGAGADLAGKAGAAGQAGTTGEAGPTGAGTPVAERVVRVTALRLDRLVALAGEALVESRRLKPFSDSLLRLRRLQSRASRALEDLRTALRPAMKADDPLRSRLAEAERELAQSQGLAAELAAELEQFARRSTGISHRQYEEILACRMRPFGDGVQAFPRMVRDLGASLGKEVRLEVAGLDTPVDRDILERLEAPLGHLLRNAVDHGIESPEQRSRAGKARQGTLRIEARHRAGLLRITVEDDGAGISLERLRAAIVARGLSDPATASRLAEDETLEFLFLPGFSLKEAVTQISGRGVGLDVVRSMVREVRGSVRVSTRAGEGTRFVLEMPLTLSVVRALLVDVGGEPYAFPLAQVVRSLRVPRERVESLEGRQHITVDGRPTGLIPARQIFGVEEGGSAGGSLPVLVVGDGAHRYGIVVDRFLGERELVVQPLDGRLGKVKDINAGAIMEDGAPVLIVDVEDLLRSVEQFSTAGRFETVRQARDQGKPRKRVLVVEDSLTVRELERKLLDDRGYEVEVAVNGMDGWNAVRTGRFDLVITDVDMPRMDGIELTGRIKRDPHLQSLPVMIVSYKEREEDQRRGLEAGADYYLAKGSFQDDSLLRAVSDLIGEAGE